MSFQVAIPWKLIEIMCSFHSQISSDSASESDKQKQHSPCPGVPSSAMDSRVISNDCMFMNNKSHKKTKFQIAFSLAASDYAE